MPTVGGLFDAALEPPPTRPARFPIMSDPHNPSDDSAAPHEPYIAALDGLRGVAVMLVAGGHYMAFEGGAPLSVTASTLAGLGMTLCLRPIASTCCWT